MHEDPFFFEIYSQHTYEVGYNSRTTATCIQLWNTQPRKLQWWEGRKRRSSRFEEITIKYLAVWYM